MSEKTLKAIAVVAELTGTELSRAALLTMEADLAEYPEAAALRALDRFRKESKFRLTLAAIIDLIEQEDGRPSADEAWAMCPRGEDESVFWNDEIQAALGVARPVMDSGDAVGARMAFRDAYDRIVRESRTQKRSPNWSLSLGWDKAGRTDAVTKALSAGLLTQEQASLMLPAPVSPLNALIDGKTPLLTDATESERQCAERGIAMIRETIDRLNQRSADDRARYEASEKAYRAEVEARRSDQLRRAAEKMAKDAENGA